MSAPESPSFPKATEADWLDAVRELLKGRDLQSLAAKGPDGNRVAPLPSGTDPTLPGAARATTHEPVVAQRIPLAEVNRERLTAERASGVTAFIFSASTSAHSDTSFAAQVGAVATQLSAARATDPESPPPTVAIDCGSYVVAGAAALVSSWRRHGDDLNCVQGSYGADPIGAVVRGPITASLEELTRDTVALAKWSRDTTPAVTTFDLDGALFHEAGADADQELGFTIANAVATLRHLTDAGFGVDDACQQISVTLAAGVDVVHTVAKFRAARLLWHRIATASGATANAAEARIRAQISERALSRLSPWVNLLRCTVGAVAASIANVEWIVVPAFTDNTADAELADRMARNLQHMLREESHLTTVIDPAAGAPAFEERTRAIADGAWKVFQTIEERGGIAAAVESGWLHDQVAAAAERRAARVETRDLPLVGVSDFVEVPDERGPGTAKVQGDGKAPVAPDIDNSAPFETRFNAWIEAFTTAIEQERSVDVAAAYPELTERARLLEPTPLAEPFEDLQRRAATIAAAGKRPQVGLILLGTPKEHGPRTTFARRAFTAGGFETVELPVDLLHEELPETLCICGTDGAYAEQVTELLAKLAQEDRWIVLAGKMGESEGEWRSAGLSDCVHIGGNLYRSLDAALARLG